MLGLRTEFVANPPRKWLCFLLVAPLVAAVAGCGVGGSSSGGGNPPGPNLTGLNPTSGVVGTPVTIMGANFGATQGTSTVKFNGTVATPTSWSATSIAAPVPAGATTGNVVVTVGGVASNGVAFTVTVPAPSITNLTPSSGGVGTTVTITGANFGATQGTSTVKFNGTVATPTSWSATSIAAPVPAGATTGNVVVTVGGVASNGVSFTVQSDTTAPVVTMTAPPNGATVSGTITLSATATDPDSPVSFVQFRVDGINIGAQLTATPYSISFDTTTISNGSHTFTAVAQDPSANQGASSGVVITVSNSQGAVPTLLQAKSDTAIGNPFNYLTVWKVNLPNPAQAGNCLVVVATAFTSTQTFSVSDDKGNIWNTTTVVNDGPSNVTLQVFYALNVAAGTQKITINFPGGNHNGEQVQLFEFNNVAAVSALDAETGQVTSGSTIGPGGITTNLAGDLIITSAVIDGCPGGCSSVTAPMTWTPGSGATMAILDNGSYLATQFQVQSVQGAISPTLTSSMVSTSAIAKVIALKASASSQGAANPAGIRVRHIESQTTGNGTVYNNYTGTSFTFQLPVDGNLIAYGWTGSSSNKPTTITSSPALTWGHCAASSDQPTGSINSTWWWYAVGATPGTLYSVTISGFGSTPHNLQANIFDISGAAASPFDVCASSTGNNLTHPTPGETGVLVNGPLITPSTSNGLILAEQQEDQDTVVNVTPGTYDAVDIGVYAGPAGEGDQGLMAYVNPDTSAVQVVWNYSGYENGVTGVGAYCSQAIAFKAGP